MYIVKNKFKLLKITQENKEIQKFIQYGQDTSFVIKEGYFTNKKSIYFILGFILPYSKYLETLNKKFNLNNFIYSTKASV